jgi:hypothetical protein
MKVQTGIASTTHVDLHSDRLSKSALEDMARQIGARYVPYLIEHDWNKHVGVILYGKVFQLKDREYALGVVVGLFENEGEVAQFINGQPNVIGEGYRKYLRVDELIQSADQRNQVQSGILELSESTNVSPSIANLLEAHLDSTKVLPDGTVYKVKFLVVPINDLRIELYPKDHFPTHFHVISKQRGINSRFDIDTLEPMSTKAGRVRNSDIKKIQNFFKTHPLVLQTLKRECDRLQH